MTEKGQMDQTRNNGRTELIQRCLYNTMDTESASRELCDLIGDQIKNDNDKFIYNMLETKVNIPKPY